MSTANSFFGTTNNPVPIGPPLPANIADNGLSVDPVTGRIVLGNDMGDTLAALLSNREIPMDGFSFRFTENGSLQFLVDPAGDYGIGDLLTLNNGTWLSIGDPSSIITMGGLVNGSPSSQVFSIDALSEVWQFGDIDNAGNGARLRINNLTEQFRLETSLQLFLFASPQSFGFGELLGTFNGSQIGIDDLNEAFAFQSTAKGRMLATVGSLSLYELGDIDELANGTQLSINDSTRITQLRDNAGLFLFVDRPNGTYSFGDIDGAANFVDIAVDDFNQRFVVEQAGNDFLRMDMAAMDFRLGDIDNTVNGNFIAVDDTASEVIIDNIASDAIVRINGVAGFTGTVTPVISITVNGGIVTAVT